MALPINIDNYAATIFAGQSLSGAVTMGADTLVAISMPLVWTAAGLTFQVSPDGGTTWQELYDGAGNEFALTVAAGLFIVPLAFPSSAWRGINLLRVRSGTLGAPVVQAAGAVLTLVGRPETC